MWPRENGILGQIDTSSMFVPHFVLAFLYTAIQSCVINIEDIRRLEKRSGDRIILSLISWSYDVCLIFSIWEWGVEREGGGGGGGRGGREGVLSPLSWYAVDRVESQRKREHEKNPFGTVIRPEPEVISKEDWLESVSQWVGEAHLRGVMKLKLHFSFLFFSFSIFFPTKGNSFQRSKEEEKEKRLQFNFVGWVMKGLHAAMCAISIIACKFSIIPTEHELESLCVCVWLCVCLSMGIEQLLLLKRRKWVFPSFFLSSFYTRLMPRVSIPFFLGNNEKQFSARARSKPSKLFDIIIIILTVISPLSVKRQGKCRTRHYAYKNIL